MRKLNKNLREIDVDKVKDKDDIIINALLIGKTFKSLVKRVKEKDTSVARIIRKIYADYFKLPGSNATKFFNRMGLEDISDDKGYQYAHHVTGEIYKKLMEKCQEEDRTIVSVLNDILKEAVEEK